MTITEKDSTEVVVTLDCKEIPVSECFKYFSPSAKSEDTDQYVLTGLTRVLCD